MSPIIGAFQFTRLATARGRVAGSVSVLVGVGIAVGSGGSGVCGLVGSGGWACERTNADGSGEAEKNREGGEYLQPFHGRARSGEKVAHPPTLSVVRVVRFEPNRGFVSKSGPEYCSRILERKIRAAEHIDSLST
jgi:hypothetical protein